MKGSLNVGPAIDPLFLMYITVQYQAHHGLYSKSMTYLDRRLSR
jgi:hypothetical protein